MLHKNINLGDVHKIYNWEVQDLTALNTLAVTQADIGKVARKLDDNTFLILTAVTPVVTWGSFGSGSGGSPLQSTEVLFNDLSPIEIGSVTAGKKVLSVLVLIEEAWDGAGASATVGTSTDNALLVSSQDIDITSIGTYEVFPAVTFGATETINLYIAPGTLATTGKIFVVLNLSN